MLRKKKNVSPGQILLMTDEDNNLVSVANTSDNGWETAIKNNGLWFIKMGNHADIIRKAKNIDEARNILENIDAEKSIYSNV